MQSRIIQIQAKDAVSKDADSALLEVCPFLIPCFVCV
jgi:hypothetical protein